QAEDGIRDRNVTGVQTCALPISSFNRCRRMSSERFWRWSSGDPQFSLMTKAENVVEAQKTNSNSSGSFAPNSSNLWLTNCPPIRSEERRVGKESTCRWPPKPDTN